MHLSAERIKIGLMGPTGGGKTHFLHAFLFGEGKEQEISPTLAVEFYERIMVVGHREAALRIWDTSGS